MKNLVIELHTLIPYAVNAANCGEYGEVKNATIGGISRVVMSSQAIKYAIRTDMAKDNIRTNYHVNEILNKCFEIDSGMKDNADFITTVIESFGISLKSNDKKKNKQSKQDEENENQTAKEVVDKIINGIGVKSGTTEVTSTAEIEEIANELVKAYKDGCDKDEIKQRLSALDRYVDLWTAAFGRMSTNALFGTMEGAVQTAMSYSVDPFLHQSDYFSVIDSLKMKYERNQAGAANRQDRSISANLMYRYMNISIETLARNYRIEKRIKSDNVYDDKEANAFANFVADLIMHFCYCHPIAKQHGMASMPTPSVVAIFTGKNIFPCTMDTAFNKVVQASYNKSTVEEAASRVVSWTENDMLVNQYDSTVLWTPQSVEESKTVETRHSINGVYDYVKNDIVNMVLSYLQELREESVNEIY